MSNEIVVVCDDPVIEQMIATYFGEHELPVISVSGQHGLARYLMAGCPRLVILDPHSDRLELLREIRCCSEVPVIITIDDRWDESDCVVGLELGADDFVTKPFACSHLLARVRVLLRRHEMGRLAQSRKPERDGYRFCGWRLEFLSRKLFDSTGVAVALTKSEYALLLAFLDSPGRVLTRQNLLQASRIYEDIADRSIDVLIMRLRRKLETDSSVPCCIQTVRGVGYLFTMAVEPLYAGNTEQRRVWKELASSRSSRPL